MTAGNVCLACVCRLCVQSFEHVSLGLSLTVSMVIAGVNLDTGEVKKSGRPYNEYQTHLFVM